MIIVGNSIRPKWVNIFLFHRLQLERQRQESDRLSSQLIGDGFNSSTSRVGTVLHIPNSPSKTGFSTLPSTELFGARRATGPGLEVNPP